MSTQYPVNWQGFGPSRASVLADRCYANGDQLPASIGKPADGLLEATKALFMRSSVFTRLTDCSLSRMKRARSVTDEPFP